MPADRYSRTVAIFKVLLPMAALGLLSTLFLLSRVVAPPQSVPFAQPEIRDRLLNQQITGPYYTGMSADGDEITFIAETVTTPDGFDGAKSAREVDATFNLANGSVIDVTSDTGFFDLARDYTTLSGQVVVHTSRGYVLHSEELIGRISALDLRSPDRVTGEMPGADLEAGSMMITAEDSDAPAYFRFKDGVKLIYDPKRVKD